MSQRNSASAHARRAQPAAPAPGFDQAIARFRQDAQQIDRYLRLVNWARRRYTRDGQLTLSVGGVPSKYSRIEHAAFRKFMVAPSERTPDRDTLLDARQLFQLAKPGLERDAQQLADA